jgi:hypothetical protein
MIVPPMKHQKRAVPVTSSQRFLGRLAMILGVVLALLVPFAGLLVATRFVVGALFIGIVPLLCFLIVGLSWLILELIRRQDENNANEEYKAEVAQHRAEAKRHKREWEADLAARQAKAQRVYDQELQSWHAVVAGIQAEGQRQKKAWEADLAARRTQAQRLYEQQLRSWQAVVDAIQAESHRQKTEWEADLAAKQAHARHRHEQELRSWQSVVAAIQGEAARRRLAAKNAKEMTNTAVQNWSSAAARFASDYDSCKAELMRHKSGYNDLEAQRASEWRDLLAIARDVQLNSHLSQHQISVAAISDIGAARKKTLQANGVTTAFDVDRERILRIPRFGPALTENLMQWRRNVEASFIFKSANAIPPYEKQAFESKYEHLRQLIQRQMVAGEKELKKISQDAENQLSKMSQQIKGYLTQLYQAEADVTVIPQGLYVESP